jgi:hypothetical protein
LLQDAQWKRDHRAAGANGARASGYTGFDAFATPRHGGHAIVQTETGAVVFGSLPEEIDQRHVTA